MSQIDLRNDQPVRAFEPEPRRWGERYADHHATYLIEKRQHTSLTLKERIQPVIHLSGCGVCRLFQQQSRWINRTLRSLFYSTQSQENRLSDEF